MPGDYQNSDFGAVNALFWQILPLCLWVKGGWLSWRIEIFSAINSSLIIKLQRGKDLYSSPGQYHLLPLRHFSLATASSTANGDRPGSHSASSWFDGRLKCAALRIHHISGKPEIIMTKLDEASNMGLRFELTCEIKISDFMLHQPGRK